MTHEEAIGIKIYYEAIKSANENGIELRYSSKDQIEYYKDSRLTMKEYEYLFKYFVENGEREYYIKMYISIISEFLTKLHEVHTDKKGI